MSVHRLPSEPAARERITSQFILRMKQLCEYHKGIWHMPSIRTEFEKHARAYAASERSRVADLAEQNWHDKDVPKFVGWNEVAAWLREQDSK